MKANQYLIIIMSMTLTACAALFTPNVTTNIIELEQGNYTLDNSHASLNFSVNHLGFSWYQGRFKDLQASLTFNPKQPQLSKLQAKVNMASLDVNHPEFQKKLLGPGWFDANQFAFATFVSDKVTFSGQQLSVRGQLTLKGVSRTITFNGIMVGAGINPLTFKHTMGFSLVAEISRSDFGIDAYLGPVADKVELSFNGEFVSKLGSPSKQATKANSVL
ncbi:YceI family protein [Paraferrimonas sp. SM1919]|uniref:YceI family protein n=1 Tax=Paraferrimonas sp. SM1919 TaxID=2662263 RepID=UPI0013CF6484|nr:YceI family protein [Paraferrimonas sp. SM1919]